MTDEKLEQAIKSIGKLGGLTPRGIRTHLGLNKPIYRRTAAYGHFGRDAEGDFFPWERTDLVDDLKAALAEPAGGVVHVSDPAATSADSLSAPRSRGRSACRRSMRCAGWR